MNHELQDKLKAIEARLKGHLRCLDSELHGLVHLREVALLAGQIAADSGADVELAMVAGFLHDCGRMNDGGGNEHAHLSAKIAQPLLKKLFPHLDEAKICRAIAGHADGQTTDDPLIGAVWDADRLTLVRLGHEIRVELLSTPAGKRLAQER